MEWQTSAWCSRWAKLCHKATFNSCCSFNHTGCNRCKSFTCCHLCWECTDDEKRWCSWWWWFQCFTGFHHWSTGSFCTSAWASHIVWTCWLEFSQCSHCFGCAHCWSTHLRCGHNTPSSMCTAWPTCGRPFRDSSSCSWHSACVHWMPCGHWCWTSCSSHSSCTACSTSCHSTSASSLSNVATQQFAADHWCWCLLWMDEWQMSGSSQWTWLANYGTSTTPDTTRRLLQSHCTTSSRHSLWYCSCSSCCTGSCRALWLPNGRRFSCWHPCCWSSSRPARWTPECTHYADPNATAQEWWGTRVWWLPCNRVWSTSCSNWPPSCGLVRSMDAANGPTHADWGLWRSHWWTNVSLPADLVHSPWLTCVVSSSSTCAFDEWDHFLVRWPPPDLEWFAWPKSTSTILCSATTAIAGTPAILCWTCHSWTSSHQWPCCYCGVCYSWVGTTQRTDAVCQVLSKICHCGRCDPRSWACSPLHCATMFCLDWHTPAQCCCCYWNLFWPRHANSSETHAICSAPASAVTSWCWHEWRSFIPSKYCLIYCVSFAPASHWPCCQTSYSGIPWPSCSWSTASSSGGGSTCFCPAVAWSVAILATATRWSSGRYVWGCSMVFQSHHLQTLWWVSLGSAWWWLCQLAPSNYQHLERSDLDGVAAWGLCGCTYPSWWPGSTGGACCSSPTTFAWDLHRYSLGDWFVGRPLGSTIGLWTTFCWCWHGSTYQCCRRADPMPAFCTWYHLHDLARWPVCHRWLWSSIVSWSIASCCGWIGSSLFLQFGHTSSTWLWLWGRHHFAADQDCCHTTSAPYYACVSCWCFWDLRIDWSSQRSRWTKWLEASCWHPWPTSISYSWWFDSLPYNDHPHPLSKDWVLRQSTLAHGLGPSSVICKCCQLAPANIACSAPHCRLERSIAMQNMVLHRWSF